MTGSSAGPGNNWIVGGTATTRSRRHGDDTITGGAGNDIIFSGIGND